MRKFFNYLAAAAIAVTSFVFTSCGDDDDESQNPLVGTWQYDKDASTIVINGKSEKAGSSDILGESITFKEDGSFSTPGISGSYSLNGHEFALNYQKGGKNYSIKQGEDLFDLVAGKELEMYKEFASVKVDDCRINFNGDNQLILSITITQDIDLGDELSKDESGILQAIVEAFKGQSTQNLVFNKK